MAFVAYSVALELVTALGGPLIRLRQRNRSLADQLQRACESLVLNLAEGSQRQGRDRSQHYRIAAGSAAEVRATLQVAMAWRQFDPAALSGVLTLLDRVLALLWRLTHVKA